MNTSQYSSVSSTEIGKFKVPTLRNVDLRPTTTFVKAYGHNGYFKSLEEIVHFYNTRDVEPWPAPEVSENMNTIIGNLRLNNTQEHWIVEFLKTLSDGYIDDCASDSTTAYLLSCRFRVEIEWTDFSAVTRDAFVASAGTSDTALFYWTNPNNLEVLIKAIDACTLNDKYWIYFGAATNVGYRITVTDTVGGGAPKIYTNAVGHLAQATNDTAAFDCD